MSTSKKTIVTASELMNKLQEDPDYLAKTQQSKEQWRASNEEYRLAALPIVEDLKRAGFKVESVDELRRSGTRYTTAIPVLLKWLHLSQNIGIKESIVRALSVPWARPTAARPLIAEFRAASQSAAANAGLKWAIANALSVVATDEAFTDVVDLLKDKRHGKSREMLAVALGNMRNPSAVDVLIELLNDEEVAGHALMALGKLKAQTARPYIENFLNHPKPWVRKEARKALAKLDK